MEIDDYCFEIDCFGYTLVKDVLDEETVRAIKTALIESEKKIGTDMTFNGPARHVANLPAFNPVFHQIIDHPKILPLIEHFLGADIILASLNSRIVRPGDVAQGLHRDIPMPFWNVDTPVMMNTVWVLDDYTLENGATRVVPGSHRYKGPIPAEEKIPLIIDACVKAGSVIVFNGQTWHAGGNNCSDHNRHALFGHYRVGPWMQFQCDPHRDFNPDWVEALSERQKKLLRMEKGLRIGNESDNAIYKS